MRLKKIFVLLISTAVLNGCASEPETRYVPYPVCDLFEPITYDRLADTEQTIREIKLHNVTWETCMEQQHQVKNPEGAN